MPAPTTCPISEVDRALSSYINSREDTLRIRRTLSKYLTTSLRPVNTATKNEHVNHVCPHNISAASTNPPGLKGCRLEYLQALRAHSQAQAKHRELQASLQDLQQRHVDENRTQAQADNDDGSTQGYIALLRQRRRLAELQVIQDSLEKLLSARPSHAPKDPKALVKETIGEQPDLPAERLEHISQLNDDQTWVFKLKQEVLESRANMDRAKAARVEAQSHSRGEASLQQQVYALECAKDEMVEWVQGELVKMEEDSIFLEDASPIKRPLKDNAPVDLASAEQRVRDVYTQYTAARASLIESYESLQHPPTVEQDEKAEIEAASTKQTTAPQMPITKLFPHLPHLARTSNNDRALLQQSVYLQSQIAAADQDIEDALLRLSGESHLLPAGSKDVAAWGKTALEAEATTCEFVKEKLLASKAEISGVSRVVELCTLQGEVLAAVK
ncbi:hypothetical protein HBI25_202760 [Parastagonospora nodorum]|nr:hypothetical protein HBI31_207260 [Parastagonospora nodorum]KAH5548672.1 hypothetical protein HBI25_202760 [Parastagonospora nodorum]KAH5712487.1 hypothetical protein HBI18_208760 [Parastagonospora nodorum]KAH6008648.1 hypothetical protein HBI83_174140 [Parastagonospora nodorum]